MCKDEPNKLIAAKNGSPLLIGIGENESYLASDASAILDYTRNILYLDDGEIALIDSNKINVADEKFESYNGNVSTHEHTSRDGELEQLHP